MTELQAKFVYPKDFDETKRYPLVIYIHGAGARGTDIQAVESTGVFVYRAHHEDFPAIVAAPLCYADTWFEIFEQLLAWVEKTAHLPYVDPDRVYLTGASMGGYTSWQLLMSRPDLFAAAAVLCGGGMYWNAARMKSVPVHAYHGLLDEVVYPEESIKMVNAVNRAGGKADITLYPDLGHNCWDYALIRGDAWEELFSHRRGELLAR